MHNVLLVQMGYGDEGIVSLTISTQTNMDPTSLLEDVCWISLEGSAAAKNEEKSDGSAFKAIKEQHKDKTVVKVEKHKLKGYDELFYA